MPGNPVQGDLLSGTLSRTKKGVDNGVNDSEHELRDELTGTDDQTESMSWSDDAVTPTLDGLSPSAADRIRLFMAETTVRGGASPADVADLYTSQEIVDDDGATAYLDRRFVRGEIVRDWRDFQDRLASVLQVSPFGTTAAALLTNVNLLDARQQSARSIFDDPDEDDLLDELRTERLYDRAPLLADLNDESRFTIERHILAEVLCYGVAPFRVMEMRDRFDADGDERALQYLDLPYELGDRPSDWDQLRDRALMVRARLELRGADPSVAFNQAEASTPNASAAEMLAFMDAWDPRR
jgi:hypothetical protein